MQGWTIKHYRLKYSYISFFDVVTCILTTIHHIVTTHTGEPMIDLHTHTTKTMTKSLKVENGKNRNGTSDNTKHKCTNNLLVEDFHYHGVELSSAFHYLAHIFYVSTFLYLVPTIQINEKWVGQNIDLRIVCIVVVLLYIPFV